MGNQLSLTPEQRESLKEVSSFSDDELKKLFRKFKKLDTDHSGSLSVQEFMAVPELENNPLVIFYTCPSLNQNSSYFDTKALSLHPFCANVRRVVATFDQDNNGEVDFKEFIQALSIFTPEKEVKDKLLFTFKMYDVDNDGFISNADLFHVLKAMVGQNLSEIQLQQLVDRTILKGDKDRDGKLSMEEFTGILGGTPQGQNWFEKLSLDFV